jgi:hypothetical protein
VHSVLGSDETAGFEIRRGGHVGVTGPDPAEFSKLCLVRLECLLHHFSGFRLHSRVGQPLPSSGERGLFRKADKSLSKDEFQVNFGGF